MSDLIEQLRDYNIVQTIIDGLPGYVSKIEDLVLEAADEIERQAKRIEELEATLDRISGLVESVL